MKLPSLDDLMLDEDKVEEKAKPKKPAKPRRPTESIKTPKPEKKAPAKKAKAAKKPTTPTKKEIIKKEPRVPKSQYDAEGNPILTIPDLDDVNLTDEIDRFLGEEDD